MTERLREELARIGDTAPVADVPASTWDRARRARTRDRAVVVGAAAAVLALVVGLALIPRPDRSVPVASGSSLGVPAQIWGVPERFTMLSPDESWSSDLVETDLDIGRGAAAYVTPAGLPVVIGADDGAYHLLDLPGFLGNSLLSRGREAGLTLSPDGRHLAYAWSGPAPTSDATPMPSGVRVLDLETGDVRTIRLTGGQGVMVDTVVWSPGSSWLVWRGRVATYWTDSSSTYRSSAAGRIAPGATTSEDVPDGRGEPAVAVADDGVVSLLTQSTLVTWDGHEVSRWRAHGNQPTTAAAVSPSGDRVVFGTTYDLDGISSVALPDGPVQHHVYLSGLYANGAQSRPLGWIDDDLLVARVSPVDGAGERLGTDQIVITTPRLSTTSTYRIVGHLDAAVPDSLSVAVDLMTLTRATVERPEPDWPWSSERLSLTIGLGVAGALALLAGLRWLWRRRSA